MGQMIEILTSEPNLRRGKTKYNAVPIVHNIGDMTNGRVSDNSETTKPILISFAKFPEL